MPHFNPESSFVASIMRSRRHDHGKTASRKEVLKALLEMQQDGQKWIPLASTESEPTARNVLDRTR